MRADDGDRPDLLGFDCGHDPWHKQVADFLRSGQAWQAHQTLASETLIFEGGQDDDLIGFANVFPDTKSWPKWNGKRRLPCLHIAWIGVVSRRQGQGYGAAMIQALAARAIERDLQGLYLLVDLRNHGAIAFYQRQGFQEFGGARLYVDSDGAEYLRMFLPLEPE